MDSQVYLRFGVQIPIFSEGGEEVIPGKMYLYGETGWKELGILYQTANRKSNEDSWVIRIDNDPGEDLKLEFDPTDENGLRELINFGYTPVIAFGNDRVYFVDALGQLHIIEIALDDGQFDQALLMHEITNITVPDEAGEMIRSREWKVVLNEDGRIIVDSENQIQFTQDINENWEIFNPELILETQLKEMGLTLDNSITIEKTNDGFQLNTSDATTAVNDHGVLELANGNQLISKLQIPDSYNLTVARNKDGVRMAVIYNAIGEQVRNPTPIEYSKDTTVIVRNYFGNTIWLALNEGEMRSDNTTTYITEAQNLLRSFDYEAVEHIKEDYVEKMSRVWNENFASWEEMMDYLRLTPQGQKMMDGHTGWYAQSKNAVFSDFHSGTDAFGLGFEVEYNKELGINLVRADFANPHFPNELISLYLGYEGENGDLKKFSYMYNEVTKKNPGFEEVLNEWIDGKTVMRVYFSQFSSDGLEVEDPKSLFSQYSSRSLNPGPLINLVMSSNGLYYRVLSDEKLREQVFAPGLSPAEVIKIQQGISGKNSLIGFDIRIKK